jgi:Family of unknown function (DUF5309)
MAAPTTPAGTATSYGLNVGLRLDFEDFIYLLDPYETPLQGLAGLSGETALAQGSCDEVLVSWEDETLLLPYSNAVTTTAGLNVVITTGATTINVPAGQGAAYDAGFVLELRGPITGATTTRNSEKVQVSSIAFGTNSGATDTLTITRGVLGTTALGFTAGNATSDDRVTIKTVGTGLAEGADAPAARFKDRILKTNNTQIFGPVSVQVSGTENVVRKYGLVGTEFDHQLANRLKEVAIMRELALIYGVRSGGGGSALVDGNVGTSLGTGIRTMDGLFSQCVTNNFGNGAALTGTITDAMLITDVQTVWGYGGRPDRILCGPALAVALSQLQSQNIRYEQATNARGQVINFYDTDFGRLQKIMHRYMQPNDSLLFSREQAVIEHLRPLMFEMLAKTGDSTKGQVVSEFTLKLHRERHALARRNWTVS